MTLGSIFDVEVARAAELSADRAGRGRLERASHWQHGLADAVWPHAGADPL